MNTKTALIVAASLITASAVIFFFTRGSKTEEVEQSTEIYDIREYDFDQAVPEYVVQKGDDGECQEFMLVGYDMAYWSFKNGNHTRVTMDGLYKTIMAKQEFYNVSLASNRDFQWWAQTDGWEEGWNFVDENGPTPMWDPDLAELWSKEFNSIEELKQAFVALFYWRYYNGMEPYAMVWRRNLLSLMPYPDLEYFRGCSARS